MLVIAENMAFKAVLKASMKVNDLLQRGIVGIGTQRIYNRVLVPRCSVCWVLRVEVFVVQK